MAKGKYHDWLTPEGLLILEGWARDGLVDKQIAENIGISERTFAEWKASYSAISSVLKKGNEVVDRQVENALLKRALGYTYDEVTSEGGVEKKRVTKEVLPDIRAQIFWLKNRMPEKYLDKQSIELSKPIDESVREMEEYFEQQKKTGP